MLTDLESAQTSPSPKNRRKPARNTHPDAQEQMPAATADRVRRPPRGEYAKTAQRRLEIIGAAAATFSELGFRDGSLREVAQRVGITHAGIRHHFASKVDLLMAVLEWRDEAALSRARATHPVGIEVLHAWIESTRRNVGNPMLVDLELTLAAEATTPEHPANEYFKDRYKRGTEILVRAFKAIEVDGKLAKGMTPQSAAKLFLSSTLGLQTLWLRDRSVDVPGELTAQAGLLLAVPFR